MFNNYLARISGTQDLKELKTIANEIYNDQKLLRNQKRSLLQIYKAKIQELYFNTIKNSENQLFKTTYLLVKKYPAPEVGKLIHLLKDQFNPIERDVLFNEYEKHKYQNVKTESNGEEQKVEPIEPF